MTDKAVAQSRCVETNCLPQSSCTMSEVVVTSTGSSPLWVLKFTSAPLCIRRRAMDVWPRLHAQCRAVLHIVRANFNLQIH